MKDIEKVVKATVNGEPKEDTITIAIPEDHSEAVKEYGKDVVYAGWLRQLITDKTNAQRVIMKGGEAKEKRAKMKLLLEKILGDEDLKARVAEETGIEL